MIPRPTFAGRWSEAVAARADEPFLLFLGSDGRTTRWTYAEFDDLVARVAGGLAARGVRQGDAVHLVLRNSPAFVATWLAVSRLGAWMVPSDPEATVPELEGHMRRTSSVVSVCGLGRAADLPHAIAVDEDDTELAPLLGGPVAQAEVGPHDRLAVMFTSGTTSAPKGVELSQAGYAFAGDVMASASASTPTPSTTRSPRRSRWGPRWRSCTGSRRRSSCDRLTSWGRRARRCSRRRSA
jgi:carnitine-CoA ligase